jgi:hypothetical protein
MIEAEHEAALKTKARDHIASVIGSAGICHLQSHCLPVLAAMLFKSYNRKKRLKSPSTLSILWDVYRDWLDFLDNNVGEDISNCLVPVSSI